MLTREEYEKTYVRMMDSLREHNKGEHSCQDVSCKDCPFYSFCGVNSKTYDTFAFIEAVEKWGKEHPIVTNADKFEEVFGVMPMRDIETRRWLCPMDAGLVKERDDCNGFNCDICKEEFWNSEYVEPKIGRVTPNTEIMNGGV